MTMLSSLLRESGSRTLSFHGYGRYCTATTSGTCIGTTTITTTTTTSSSSYSSKCTTTALMKKKNYSLLHGMATNNRNHVMHVSKNIPSSSSSSSLFKSKYKLMNQHCSFKKGGRTKKDCTLSSISSSSISGNYISSGIGIGVGTSKNNACTSESSTNINHYGRGRISSLASSLSSSWTAAAAATAAAATTTTTKMQNTKVLDQHQHQQHPNEGRSLFRCWTMTTPTTELKNSNGPYSSPSQQKYYNTKYPPPLITTTKGYHHRPLHVIFFNNKNYHHVISLINNVNHHHHHYHHYHHHHHCSNWSSSKSSFRCFSTSSNNNGNGNNQSSSKDNNNNNNNSHFTKTNPVDKEFVDYLTGKLGEDTSPFIQKSTIGSTTTISSSSSGGGGSSNSTKDFIAVGDYHDEVKNNTPSSSSSSSSSSTEANTKSTSSSTTSTISTTPINSKTTPLEYFNIPLPNQSDLQNKTSADELNEKYKNIELTQSINIEKSRKKQLVTVRRALAGNIIIALSKLAAFLHSGSSAMMSEFVHSVVDCGNQSLLLVGLRDSGNVADKTHTYGYGKSIYFWALVSALGTFFLGAGVSMTQAIPNLIYGSNLQEITWHVWSVLGVSFVVDGYVFSKTLIEVRDSMPSDKRTSLWKNVINMRDPATLAILLEDGAACLGVVMAVVGLGLTQAFDMPVYDALAGVGISGLLATMGLILVRVNHSFLLGQSVDREIREGIEKILLNRRSIDAVHSVQSQWTGAETFSFKAEVDFDGTFLAAKLMPRYQQEFAEAKATLDQDLRVLLSWYAEDVMRTVEREVRHIEAEIRKEYPGAQYIELEPMSKDADRFAIDDGLEASLKRIEIENLNRYLKSLYQSDISRMKGGKGFEEKTAKRQGSTSKDDEINKLK